MRSAAYSDLTHLWTSELRSMYRGEVDHVSKLETIRYDSVLSSDSCSFSYDLGADTGFPYGRWAKLVSDYLEPGATARFLDRAVDLSVGDSKPGGVVSLATKQELLRDKHYLGNCIMGFTWRGDRTSPVLTMHSRVSYLGYIAPLDLALARAVAAAIATKLRLGVEDIAFRWVVDSLQFHGINSLPTIARRFPELKPKASLTTNPTPRSPTEKLVAEWWPIFVRVARKREVANFRPVASAVRRYRQSQQLPRTPVTALTLRCLWRAGR